MADTNTELVIAVQDPLLTPAEVADLFRVNPKTVVRWAKAGLIPYIRTLGGHRRYRQSDVLPKLVTLRENH